MKNKKGVSVGRIILYCLFLTLIFLFIYTLFISFKAMKKNDSISSNDFTTSLRMVDNNSIAVKNLYNKVAYPFVNINDVGNRSSDVCQNGSFIYVEPGTYSVTVESALLTDYRYGFVGSLVPGYNRHNYTLFDSGWQTTTTCTLNVTSSCYLSLYINNLHNNFNLNFVNSLNYMINVGSPSSYVDFVYSQFNTSAVSYFANSSLYYSTSSQPINNDGNLSSTLFVYNDPYTQSPYTSSCSTQYNILNITSSLNDLVGYCYDFSSSVYNSANSFAINFTCNIPIDLFNFSIVGYATQVSSSIYMIYSTDVSTNQHIFFNANRLVYTDLLTGASSNANYITSFTLFFYTSSSSTNSYYFYYPCIEKESYSYVSLVFDYVELPDDYQLGYWDGVRDGREQADSSLRDSVVKMNDEINQLNSEIDNLNSQIRQQSDVISYLRSQLDNAQNNFKGLFFTMADIPFRTVSNALGFEFFGVNLFKFFVGIITALGILWLIKRLYK